MTTDTAVSWVKVNENVHRSDVGVLKHTRRGWYWHKAGDRAGRVGPFERFAEAKAAAEHSHREHEP